MEVPRDYRRFDRYVDDLVEDAYSQSIDEGHTAWAEEAIGWWSPDGSVLDIGCGQGFCQPIFARNGVLDYVGITISIKDVKIAKDSEFNVYMGDMTFLAYDDDSFDNIFARHILEHSPFPIITLMEWRRVAKNLMLVAPCPDYWGWNGKNHYSMANDSQLWWWLRRSGWKIVEEGVLKTTDDIYIEYYADNQERLSKGRSLSNPPGPPKVLEYWFCCERSEVIRE